MELTKWHLYVAEKIRIYVLIFMLFILLDNSTIFNIAITDTFSISSNLSTWLTYKTMGPHFIDSFNYYLVNIYLLLSVLLFGIFKAPYRNIWILEFSILCTTLVIIINSLLIIENDHYYITIINASFQSIKLIPLIIAYHWTRKLRIPLLI
ncbi:MAG: hypothetical protein MK207_10515 [Saprospiraceae bacterium]|nr:hypothetical protein [Saprospiraceae bacterium]